MPRTALGGFGHAPTDMRADQLQPQGARLRYVSARRRRSSIRRKQSRAVASRQVVAALSQPRCTGSVLAAQRARRAASRRRTATQTSPASPQRTADLVERRAAAPVHAEVAAVRHRARRPPPARRRSLHAADSVEPRRRSPSVTRSRVRSTCPAIPTRSPSPSTSMRDAEGLPDRWRIVSMLGYRENLLDPYNGNNWLKGDSPAFGEDWFFNLIGISDTLVEPRRFPVPVGDTGHRQPRQQRHVRRRRADRLRRRPSRSKPCSTRATRSSSRPTTNSASRRSFNISYVDTKENGLVDIDAPRAARRATTTTSACRSCSSTSTCATSRTATTSTASASASSRSSRTSAASCSRTARSACACSAPATTTAGSTTSRAFRRIEKDTNSGLNDVSGSDALRDDDVFVANLYRQDFPVLGFTSQATSLYNRNREGDDVVLRRQRLHRAAGVARPRAPQRLRRRLRRLQRRRPLRPLEPHRRRCTARSATTTAACSSSAAQDIRAGFAAAEVSRDFDWMRVRVSAAYAQRRRRSVRRHARPASTRSSRTRSSPAPTRATGSARRCR